MARDPQREADARHCVGTFWICIGLIALLAVLCDIGLNRVPPFDPVAAVATGLFAPQYNVSLADVRAYALAHNLTTQEAIDTQILADVTNTLSKAWHCYPVRITGTANVVTVTPGSATVTLPGVYDDDLLPERAPPATASNFGGDNVPVRRGDVFLLALMDAATGTLRSLLQAMEILAHIIVECTCRVFVVC